MPEDQLSLDEECIATSGPPLRWACPPLPKGPRSSPVSDDPNTAWFMSFVDCDPWDVLDIPKAPNPAEKRELRIKALGATECYFSKDHKGKLLRDIPVDFLEWLVSRPKLSGPAAKGVEKFKDAAREYLSLTKESVK